jgi:hypothetical protein
VFASPILETNFKHSNYISLGITAAHIKSSLHSRIPFLPSLLNHLRLPSQETPSILSASLRSPLYNLGADPTENTVPSVIAQQYLDCCLFVAVGMCLPSRCLVMNVYFGFAIPAFRSHVALTYYKNSKPCCSITHQNRKLNVISVADTSKFLPFLKLLPIIAGN